MNYYKSYKQFLDSRTYKHGIPEEDRVKIYQMLNYLNNTNWNGTDNEVIKDTLLKLKSLYNQHIEDYNKFKNDLGLTLDDINNKIPEVQTSINGTNKKYIYSNTGEDNKSVLCGDSEFVFEQDNSSIFLKFKSWGSALYNVRSSAIPIVTNTTPGLMSKNDKIKLDSASGGIIYKSFNNALTIGRTSVTGNNFTTIVPEAGKYKLRLGAIIKPVETILTLTGVSGIETILSIQIKQDDVILKTIPISILNSGNNQYHEIELYLDLELNKTISISANVGSTDSNVELPINTDKTFIMQKINLI